MILLWRVGGVVKDTARNLLRETFGVAVVSAYFGGIV